MRWCICHSIPLNLMFSSNPTVLVVCRQGNMNASVVVVSIKNWTEINLKFDLCNFWLNYSNLKLMRVFLPKCHTYSPARGRGANTFYGVYLGFTIKKKKWQRSYLPQKPTADVEKEYIFYGPITFRPDKIFLKKRRTNEKPFHKNMNDEIT